MKILGYTYLLDMDKTQDEIGAAGRCHTMAQKIQVASDIHWQAKESTLLHEIIEAIDFHMGFEMDHEKVMSFEAALFTVLKDNGVSLEPLFWSKP